MTNQPETTVEQWNTRYPIGTPVTAYPSARPKDDPNPERLTTRTRSEAFVFAGTAVVTVDGYERIALTHVDPVQSADSYVPPAKYVRSDNVDCCPHARPIGPGSCEFCWDLVKWEAVDGPLAEQRSATTPQGGPPCGNNPNYRLTPGDEQAVDDFKAYLARRAVQARQGGAQT